MQVRLARAQLYRASNLLDVTVKSCPAALRPFAPTWSMVMGVKRGTLSCAEYAVLYFAQLNGIPKDELLAAARFIYDRATDGVATLGCYCRYDEFCHTYLLAFWLSQRFPRAFENSCSGNSEVRAAIEAYR